MVDSTNKRPDTPQRVQETEKEMIYDYNQRDYRKTWQEPASPVVHKFEIRALREILPEQSGWFIDIASGYGRLLPLFHRLDRKIVLVDYAVNLLEMAAETYPYENVYFVAANAYHLPFRSESFDAGLSVRTFHHMNLPQAFLLELGRVMRGGATVVVEYPNKRSLFRIFRYGLKCFRHDQEQYSELVFGTHPAYFAQLSKEAGFRVLRNRGTGFLGRILNKAPFFSLPVTIGETALDWVFGPTELAPRNFAELQKSSETRATSPIVTQPKDLMDLLVCPVCRGSIVEVENQGVRCQDCGRLFPRTGSILDLRYRDDTG